MKKLMFVLLTLLSGQLFAQYGLQHIKALHSLNGSWESERKRGTLIEQWAIINDSSMIGYSFIKTATDSIPEEKMELVLRSGKIFFIASAARQNNDTAVAFTLTNIENGKYFFENKQHDFPQRILYHLVDNKTLRAAIYGPLNGKETEVTFNFTRREQP